MGSHSLDIQVGKFQVHLLQDGFYRLDGGAMFGVVPKVVWEKRYPADEQNRIRMGLNSLLVRTPDALVLVETGIGSALEEKEKDLFALEQDAPLTAQIEALGVSLDEIDHVIPTHLNFDHAGHCTKKLPDGTFVPTFPRARYHIQAAELAFAKDPLPELKVAFPPELYEPVEEAGLWDLHQGQAEIVPGVSVIHTGGHTPGHQIVLLESEGEKLVFWGDLVPTSRHLDPRYGLAFDLFPVEVMVQRRKLMEQSIAENWLHAYPHEPEMHFLRARRGNKYYETEVYKSR